MKERPILFSAPMVRALLAGTKTQTRRAWPEQPPAGTPIGYTPDTQAGRYGKRGDQLWVREAWRADKRCDHAAPREISPRSAVMYEADGGACQYPLMTPGKLRPGMFMPRWASRITLEVTGVRVERLWEISQADVQAEGCDGYVLTYAKLWESINGPGSWDANPWVWVVEFKRNAPEGGAHA
jgi:hypothetical protein